MQGHAYYTAQLKQLETHIIFSLLTPFNPLFQLASYNFNDELAISRPVFFNDTALSPRGVLRISSDGDDRRIFLGLKFSIPGFFWVGKFSTFFGRAA